MFVDGDLDGQQVADNIPVANPGQVNLYMQLGMVLVSHIEFHAEREGQTLNPPTGPHTEFELQACANFFAPQAAISAQMVVDILDKWGDFFTSLLLSPKSFSIAKEILSSGMWAVDSQYKEH